MFIKHALGNRDNLLHFVVIKGILGNNAWSPYAGRRACYHAKAYVIDASQNDKFIQSSIRMQLQGRDGARSSAQVTDLRTLLRFCRSHFGLPVEATVADVISSMSTERLALKRQSSETAVAERKARRFQAELILLIGDTGESV